MLHCSTTDGHIIQNIYNTQNEMSKPYIVSCVRNFHHSQYPIYCKDGIGPGKKRALYLQINIYDNDEPINIILYPFKIVLFYVVGRTDIPVQHKLSMSVKSVEYDITKKMISIRFNSLVNSILGSQSTFSIKILLLNQNDEVLYVHKTRPIIIVTKDLPKEVTDDEKMIKEYDLHPDDIHKNSIDPIYNHFNYYHILPNGQLVWPVNADIPSGCLYHLPLLQFNNANIVINKLFDNSLLENENNDDKITYSDSITVNIDDNKKTQSYIKYTFISISKNSAFSEYKTSMLIKRKDYDK